MSTEADDTGNVPYSSSKPPEIRELRYDKEKKINYDPNTGEVVNLITWIPTGELYQPEKEPETGAESEPIETEGKEAEPDDNKRAEITDAIIKAKLHTRTEEKLVELAERYDTSIDIIRNIFYDSACAVKFNTAKKIESEVNRTFDRLKFTCHNKFKKREIVTFDDGNSQQLYNMITHVVVKQGKLKSDEVLLEFHIDDRAHNIVDGVFEITSEKVLNFEGFKAAFYKRFHYLPPIQAASKLKPFLQLDNGQY